MSKILIGLLLIFLDFNFTFNTVTIGLLPDFIGYILLTGGLAELLPQSAHFGRARPFAILMAIYTAILYALDLIGFSASLGYLATALGLLSTALSLYISFHIVQGVMEMERNWACNLNGASLYAVWKGLAATNILAYALIFIPGLNILGLIACFIMGIAFLVAFSRAKKAYEAETVSNTQEQHGDGGTDGI